MNKLKLQDRCVVIRLLSCLIGILLLHGCSAEAAQSRVTVTATGYEVFEPVISVAWVDNDQLLFAGSKSGPDPKRRSLEHSRIYLWNETTKTVRVYSEVAIEDRFCFSQGKISYMVRVDKNARRAVYLEGSLGSEQEVERSLDEPGATSKFSCGMRKYEDFVPPLPKTHLNLILREGDGYLTLRPHSPKEERTRPRNIMLYPEDGAKPVTLPITWDERIGGWGTTYSEYRRAYVLPPEQLIPARGPGNWSSDEPRLVYLLGADGRVERVSIPPTVVFRLPRPTSAGWIYGGGTNKSAGLNLYDGSKVARVDAGGVSEIAVSPNGCKAAVAINNRPLDMGTPTQLKIFSFCLQGN